MGEVLGAVIATALVLIAVFVPIAFFPGTTGRLYAQFAMTIAFAVALSAFNAVTLTPALAGAAARPPAPRQEPLLRATSSAASPPAPTATSASSSAACGRGGRWCVVFFLALGLTYWVNTQGAAGVRARGGPGLLPRRRCRRRPDRRCSTPAAIARQAEQIFMADPDVLACSRSWASASAARRRTRGSCSCG